LSRLLHQLFLSGSFNATEFLIGDLRFLLANYELRSRNCTNHGGTINRREHYLKKAHCHKVVLNTERNMCLSSGVFHSLCNPSELQKVHNNKQIITTKTKNNTQRRRKFTPEPLTRKAETKMAEMPKFPNYLLLSTPLERFQPHCVRQPNYQPHPLRSRNT
jgi:hypothetical protein